MKLDSIVYDINTLGSAIQSDLVNESTTFQAMYPSDTATEVVKTLASYSSMLQYMLVTTMANCYTDTAYSPTGIYQLAETLGNRLHGNISSQTTCTITRTNLIGYDRITIPSGSQFTIDGVNFFNEEDLSFPYNINIINNVKLIQGTKEVTEKISHGLAGERFYFSKDFECNTNLVTVTVNGAEWYIADTFLPTSTENVVDPEQLNTFVLCTDPDGRSYLKCGNGANGVIPPDDASIKISWISNQGSKGNITNPNAEVQLITPIYYTTTDGKRVQLEVEVSNLTATSGGFDTQSLDVLKDSSPYVFASGDRCVRRNDYKAMLLNKCGYLTCNVWGEYEQALMEGTYNKIMMNMVYYTGIKTIQSYDLQQLATGVALDTNAVDNLSYSTNDLENPANNRKWYYEVTHNTYTPRGFLGSYSVELSSFTRENRKKSLIYSDKCGTGILSCDYIDNKEFFTNVENAYTYEDYILDDLGLDLVPYYIDSENLTPNPNYDQSKNMYIYSVPAIVALKNQQESVDYSFTNDLFNTGAEKSQAYNANNCYLFSGKSVSGAPTLLTPNNPIQILISFENEREVLNMKPTGEPAYGNKLARDVFGGSIAGFIFKTPNASLLKDFIGSFAVYGTTSNVISLDATDNYINIKNDSNWTKLTDTITIADDLDANQWTNWFTINTFDTATGEWKSYNKYCIEIYSFREELVDEVISGRRLAIGEIRAIYGNQKSTEYERPIENQTGGTPRANLILPGRCSYIYYDNNNLTTIKIPYNNTGVRKEDQNLIIPESMQYFKYTAIVNGAIIDNEYTTGQELILTSADEGGEDLGNYCFKVKINDNNNEKEGNNCTVEICQEYDPISSRNIYYSNLYGKKQLSIISAKLRNINDMSSGHNATITITSEPLVDFYENYVGNFYSSKDIQSADLPVIDKYNHFTTYLEFKQPKVKNIYVDISVEYENISKLNEVKNNIISEIRSLFSITPYYMGKTFSVSDLWKTVSLVPGVKRLIVNSPTANISALPYELIALPASNLVIRDIASYDTQLTIKN